MYVQLKDKEVVELFVDHLRQNGHPGLFIDSRPDEPNSTTQDIDAIAGEFAIEHTRVDTVTDQSRNSAWFEQALGNLVPELKEKINFHLDVIFPHESITSGQNWAEINSAIKDFILFETPKYSDGTHEIVDAPKVPFCFYIRKNSKYKNKLYFTKFAPNIEEYFGELGTQINRKASKLKQYKFRSLTTILLLESNDLSLMNEAVMLDGLRNTLNLKLPEGVVQLWFVDTSIVEDILFYNLTDLITQKTI